MAPSAVPIEANTNDFVVPKMDTLGLPDTSYARLKKAGINLDEGYPYRPDRPLYLQDVYNIRNTDRPFEDAGARADKSKSALFGAASKVTDLTAYIGTEIEGLQLKDLTNQQRDELALLIAERSVVFFRDQDLSPQQQKALGEYYGEVEVHVWFCLALPASILPPSVALLVVLLYTDRLPSPKCPKSQASPA